MLERTARPSQKRANKPVAYDDSTTGEALSTLPLQNIIKVGGLLKRVFVQLERVASGMILIHVPLDYHCDHK